MLRCAIFYWTDELSLISLVWLPASIPVTASFHLPCSPLLANSTRSLISTSAPQIFLLYRSVCLFSCFSINFCAIFTASLRFVLYGLNILVVINNVRIFQNRAKDDVNRQSRCPPKHKQEWGKAHGVLNRTVVYKRERLQRLRPSVLCSCWEGPDHIL